MTRGMFVTVLSRISGEDIDQYENTVFSDVKSSDYFSSAVAWAYSKNIVAGIGKTTFAPNLPVTREQICVMLDSYLNYAGNSLTEKSAVSKYKDDAKISSWAYESVYCMQKAGYLVVYNPYAELYHYESKSRGLEDTPEKIERFNREIAVFEKRWPEIIKNGDPYYNPNLTLESQDFSLKRI